MRKEKVRQFVAVRSFSTTPTVTKLPPPPGSLIPLFAGTAHIRVVRANAKKMPTGQYVKTDVFFPAWDLKEVSVPDGIYALDGTRILPMML